MSECYLLSFIPVLDPRWICNRPYLQSETLAEAQSHQLIASFALRQISCAMCSRTGVMSHSQSQKKTPGQHFKETSFKFSRTSNSWDLSTRVCVYIYICISRYCMLLSESQGTDSNPWHIHVMVRQDFCTAAPPRCLCSSQSSRAVVEAWPGQLPWQTSLVVPRLLVVSSFHDLRIKHEVSIISKHDA